MWLELHKWEGFPPFVDHVAPGCYGDDGVAGLSEYGQDVFGSPDHVEESFNKFGM